MLKGDSVTVLKVVAELVAVAILYFLVAKGSLAFASVNPSATPIWPPTGLALGLALLRGYRILPAILVGALAANLTTAGGFSASLAIALGNTLEALIGAYLINKWADGPAAFQTPTGIAKFALVVIAASTPLSATIGVTALGLAGAASSDFALIWVTWWLGDAVGAVMVCPAIVLWADALRRPRAQQESSLESLVLHAFAAFVGALALGPLLPKDLGGHALAFLAVFPLLWGALRRGPRDTSTVALILSAFAVWGVTGEGGPFMQPTRNASFLLLVSFIASITLPSLALAAAVASRERALVRRQDDYRRLVESVRDYAIFMLDAEGHVTTWNSGAARIKHFAEHEILGRHFSRFYTEEEQQAGEPAHRLRSAATTGRDESEGWRVRRDGSRFWAEVAISALRDERGDLIGFAHVTRDVSETRAAQAALEDTRARLDQAQKLEALGQLTGSVAHDFNNLLTVMAGGLHVLNRSPDPERQRTILGEMQHAVERGVELTRRLLTSARRDQPKPKPVDLVELLGGMRGILERTLGPDIRLTLKYEADLRPVTADPGEMEMALLNLAINARDAMPEGGSFTIKAENVPGGERHGSVRIAVRDTGTGMDPEARERAFEPFFSTKPPGRGTGLGLGQVQSFAERSGGSVELESEPGRGTTVTFVLPKA